MTSDKTAGGGQSGNGLRPIPFKPKAGWGRGKRRGRKGGEPSKAAEPLFLLRENGFSLWVRRKGAKCRGTNYGRPPKGARGLSREQGSKKKSTNKKPPKHLSEHELLGIATWGGCLNA